MARTSKPAAQSDAARLDNPSPQPPMPSPWGLVAPWTANVDTDAIIPKQFLKSIKKPALAPICSTSGATSTSAGEPNRRARISAQAQPDFVLNQPRYRAPASAGAQELWLRLQPRARPWALEVRAFAPSSRRELRRHLLQQLLQERPAAHRPARGRWWPSQLFDEVAPSRATRFTIDLERQVVIRPQGDRKFLRRAAVPQVLPAQRLPDDIGLTLRHRTRSPPSRRSAWPPSLAGAPMAGLMQQK